jgi:hypothetical protein
MEVRGKSNNARIRVLGKTSLGVDEHILVQQGLEGNGELAGHIFADPPGTLNLRNPFAVPEKKPGAA